jgi:aminoglycoside 3-N-acetyltransferase I
MRENNKQKGDIQIKRLGSKDRRIAKELFYLFQKEDGKKPLPPDLAYLSKLLMRTSFFVLVAYKNKKLAGGLTAYALPMYKNGSSEMFLFEIGVKRQFRQQGIGRLLIERLKELALKKKMKLMFVLTSLDNLPAQKLYESVGGALQNDIFYLIPLAGD